MGRVNEALRRAGVQGPVSVSDALGTGLGPDAFLPEPLESSRSRHSSLRAAVPGEEAPRQVLESPRLRERLSPADLAATVAEKTVIDPGMPAAPREQYRKLAATLHQRQTMTGARVVMIASATLEEGKTLTSANLALTFSESYQRKVLLIETDFRRPCIANLFNIAGVPGLREVLLGPADRTLPIHRVSAHLWVLPAGAPTSDPQAELVSERLRLAIEEARSAFDWVIVDTPPIGLIADAKLLAGMVDGAVLVVRAGATPLEMVRSAVETLGKESLFGVVLNRGRSAPENPYYYRPSKATEA